jgi:transcriptional regulator with XRE-family HTH domain
MSSSKINDRELLRLLDREGLTQSEAARKLGVSRQAVSLRLMEIRGKTTRAVVAKKIAEVVEHKIDTLGQLTKVNRHANEMLDLLIRWQSGDPDALRVLESQVKRVTSGEGDDEHEIIEVRMKDPRELALRCMAEIREQLELQMKIFETLYSMRAAEEFQHEVLEAIGEVAPDVRMCIISRLNEKRALRSAVRWT